MLEVLQHLSESRCQPIYKLLSVKSLKVHNLLKTACSPPTAGSHLSIRLLYGGGALSLRAWYVTCQSGAGALPLRAWYVACLSGRWVVLQARYVALSVRLVATTGYAFEETLTPTCCPRVVVSH